MASERDERPGGSDRRRFLKGFVAWLSKCTFNCCVPGFKALADSEKFDAGDLVYCPCCQSTYDPFCLAEQSFVAEPLSTPG